MREDAFSVYHPLTIFIFFVVACIFTVFQQHPIYLLSDFIVVVMYYLFLHGRKGIRTIVRMMPLMIFIVLFNPIVNMRGNTILFQFFERPYTLEALIYGGVVAMIFATMVLWMGCYNIVLTGDKFVCLFGDLMPSIALLLVIVLRMIPILMRKAEQIMTARSSIGKGTEQAITLKDKITSGTTVLGVLTTWSLEGGVSTGDSMLARGYGATKRTNFRLYSIKKADFGLLGIMFLCIGVVAVCAMRGCMKADFFPESDISSLSGLNIISIGSYTGFLLIPILLNIKETLQWNILKYKN